MDSAGPKSTAVRDAKAADLPGLCRLRDSAAVHEGRLRAALTGAVRFLVVVVDGEVAGFASLFLAQTTTGPAKSHIPKLSDCWIAPAHRSRGLGRALVEAREEIARAAGHRQLYVSVDPIENPRWLEFFRRRGYATLQPEPYRKIEPRHLPNGGTAEVLVWRQDLVVDLGGVPREEPGGQSP